MDEIDMTNVNFPVFASEIKQLIEQSRNRVAVQVNSAATILYWNIGKRIREEVLRGRRAEYGKRVLSELSKELTTAFGRGWGEQQLRHCVRCAEVFADEQILYTLCTELSWSHIRQLMFIDDTLKRNFYMEMCRMEHWSVRQLGDRIDSMLYERTAISKKRTKLLNMIWNCYGRKSN